jgi:hypothetical protein
LAAYYLIGSVLVLLILVVTICMSNMACLYKLQDQYSTDGYTLWGGAGTKPIIQAKINSYIPAQHADKQILYQFGLFRQ